MNPLIYLTRIEKFSAAHRMNNSELDHYSNQEIFGKCNNIHGHNYTLEVTVKGTIDRKTGMVMNITDLKNLIDQHVLKLMDHKNLDEDLDYFRQYNIISTSENICLFIWNQISEHMPQNVKLHCVKLYETDKNIVQFYGDYYESSNSN